MRVWIISGSIMLILTAVSFSQSSANLKASPRQMTSNKMKLKSDSCSTCNISDSAWISIEERLHERAIRKTISYYETLFNQLNISIPPEEPVEIMYSIMLNPNGLLNSDASYAIYKGHKINAPFIDSVSAALTRDTLKQFTGKCCKFKISVYVPFLRVPNSLFKIG